MNLLKIEFRKIAPLRAFWILSGLYLVLITLIFYGLQKMTFNMAGNMGKSLLGEIYAFPNVFHFLTYVASFFCILLGIMIIILITNEINYRTLRQNIIDGWSRVEFLNAKGMVILLIASVASILLLIITLIFGFIYTVNVTGAALSEKLVFIPAYFIQALGYMSFALLIGLLVKRSGFAIGLLLLYIAIIEPFINWYFLKGEGKYLPLKVFSDLIPNPFLQKLESMGMAKDVAVMPAGENFILGVIYIGLFTACSYFILKKRDW